MKIWSLRVSDQAIALTLNDEDLSIYEDNFEGKQMLPWWNSLDLTVYKKGKYREVGYFGTGTFLISSEVASLLQSVLQDKVELLDVNTTNYEAEMMLVNITNIIECIDHERSIIEKNAAGIGVGFETLYFNEKDIVDEDIFKIPQIPRYEIFVSDRFRDRVLKSKIKGFEFEEVWDSEFTVEMEQQLQQQYEDALAQVKAYTGPTVDWEEAYRQVLAGKALASGEWKIQLDQDNNFLRGRLSSGGQYSWIIPIYIPPILLDLQWHEVEKSDL